MNKDLNIIVLIILGVFIVTSVIVFDKLSRKDDEEKPKTELRSIARDNELSSKNPLNEWWPLKVGARKRFVIQAKAIGKGVVEQVIVEQRKIGDCISFRLRATHRYDNGHMGIEELYVSPTASQMVIPARMTSGSDFGFYKPPMVFLSSPLTVGTTWVGKTDLSETKKDGTTREAITIAWQGKVVAFEPVSVPAGRYTSCARVENIVDDRFLTREWFAKGVGVVRREVLDGPDVVVLQELVLSY